VGRFLGYRRISCLSSTEEHRYGDVFFPVRCYSFKVDVNYTPNFKLSDYCWTSTDTDPWDSLHHWDLIVEEATLSAHNSHIFWTAEIKTIQTKFLVVVVDVNRLRLFVQNMLDMPHSLRL
jgi:hypothetical protein